MLRFGLAKGLNPLNGRMARDLLLQRSMLQKARLLCVALAFLISPSVLSAPEYSPIVHKRCDAFLQRLQSARNLSQLEECFHFTFHFQELDSPVGSFNKPIRFGERIVEIDTQAIWFYEETSWLMWSKWVSWKENPALMPDGENGVDEALRLLRTGIRHMPRNPVYRAGVAESLWPLAQRFRNDLLPFVEENFLVAEELTEEKARKIRLRLNLGHVARQMSAWERARKYYEAVLALDPQNPIARRILDEEMP